MDYPQAAALCGMPRSTLKSRLQRPELREVLLHATQLRERASAPKASQRRKRIMHQNELIIMAE